MTRFFSAIVAIAIATTSPAWASGSHKSIAKAAPAHIALPSEVRPERYKINIAPDAANLTFVGHEAVSIVVNRATSRIVLNAADITIQKVVLSCLPDEPAITYDKTQQTATFTFPKSILPGRYTLAIDYSGVIYKQASGFFALDYAGDHGPQRALFTQFENSDARRFAPMWDEPGAKAVFALSVETPDGQMAVSNMPVQDTIKVNSASGPARTVTRFAETPKMSSYLLFLALGDFERVHKMVGKTDVGVVVRRGKTAQAQFALDAAAQLLPYYNDYFATPYPLPKLDFIAGPGRSQFFAAMENWGAIYYFDHALLIDPKFSTEADKHSVYVDIAHEMAHQWFGDLVTMAWWDDLWLNEGFASWMENKATDHFHPEWKIWLQTKGGEQGAMRTDARTGTHPVITPIHDVFAAADAFDAITYEKGHSVIHMLETYVGPDTFRAGVRNYIAHNAYGNTVTDDLWREIDKISPKKLTGIAHDFTLQAGVPLISASLTKNHLQLNQSRFGVDTASRAERSWRTPVIVNGLGSGPWRTLVSEKASASRLAGKDAVALLNAGQTGYFRSRYAPDLEARVIADFSQLAAEDQLGLIYDSQALGQAGYAPIADFLAIAKQAQSANEAIVQRALAQQLLSLDGLYDGHAGQSAFRAFARARLEPAFARLGWDARPGEPDTEALLRRSVISALGHFDDPAIVAEARRRFSAALADPDSLRGSTRQTVFQIVAEHADIATWDQLHALAQKASDVTDKSRLYSYLGASHDPALAEKALNLALSQEPPATDAPSIISNVAGVFPEKAFSFAVAHRQAIDAMVEPTSRTTFYAGLVSGARNPVILPQLQAFASTVPPSTQGEINKAVSGINYRLEVTTKRLPEIDAWLTTHREDGA